MDKKGISAIGGFGVAVIIVLGLLFILFLWVVGSYNGLVTADETVAQKWGDVQSTYQRRADLIPNLVDTAKEGLEFQKETLALVTALRTQASVISDKMGVATTPEELESLKAQLDPLVTQAREAINTQINVQVEAYPELDVTPITGLMDELAGTENRINWARTEYNEVVKDYRTRARRFPTVIIANMMGFNADKWKPFEAQSGAEIAPDVGDLFE